MRRIIYQFCPFHFTAVTRNEKIRPLNRLTTAVAITPNDRHKLVRNRCVIEFFYGVFVLSLRVFNFLFI